MQTHTQSFNLAGLIGHERERERERRWILAATALQISGGQPSAKCGQQTSV